MKSTPPLRGVPSIIISTDLCIPDGMPGVPRDRADQATPALWATARVAPTTPMSRRGGRDPMGLEGIVPLIMEGTPPLRGVPYPTF